MKSFLRLAALAVFASSAPAQVAADRPAIQPIESLWLTSPPLLKPQNSGAPVAEALREQRKIFDLVMILKLPPTFTDESDFTARANALMEEVGGRFALVTLPVGNQGWESSNNQRLAEREAGPFDAAKAMPQAEWLAMLEAVHTDTWIWVLEQPARMPTPEQAAQSAAEFVRFAKARHKRAGIWLSAEALGNPRFGEMTRRICEATRADADFYGWMDLPEETMRSGEDHWRETLAGLLDQILALTPAAKTIIQYSHFPKSPTGSVAGTLAYFAGCQAKGINRFCVLSQPQFFNRDPWRDFYRRLPKAAR